MLYLENIIEIWYNKVIVIGLYARGTLIGDAPHAHYKEDFV
jgi:hypothetical protein